jgi:hypothetical protein
MNKRIILLCLASLLAAGSLSAQIGDNFKAAGIGLGGSVNGSYGFNTETSDDRQILLDGNVMGRFFLVDNLSLNVSVGFSYFNSVFGGINYISSSENLSLSASLYLVPNPEADSGFADSINLLVGPNLAQQWESTSFASDGNQSTIGLTITGSDSIYFFVAQHTAISVDLGCSYTFNSVKDNGRSTNGLRFFVGIGLLQIIPNSARVDIAL